MCFCTVLNLLSSRRLSAQRSRFIIKDFRMPAYRKVSPRQLELLVEFAEANLDIALGRCSRGPQGHQIATQSWKTLATSLNAVADGVIKTSDQWRRYWIELKAKTKAKGADMRRSATRTGGGPNKLTPLTAIEERILHIAGRVAVEGLPGVQIPFQVPDAPILSPLLPQPGPSSQIFSTPSQVETTFSVHENMTPTMTPVPDMEVEWLDDEVISPPFELFPEPPNPLPAIPPTQSPPLTAAPAVLPTAQPIPAVASPAPTEASQQRNRRRRSYIRDIPRWAQDMEERRLLYEERMVTIMEKVEQRLADINQNLFNFSANLQR